MKVGIGYDIHRLVKGQKLFLGGVRIPHTKGLISHSDGDVVLHAISDAILGAIGSGDIGQHFPNTDTRYKDMPSSGILTAVAGMMKKKGFAVNNVDTMVLAEEPKLHPFRVKMIDVISGILGVDAGSVNIKATTNETVGSIGRGEAIAALAVVSLEEMK